MAAVILAAGGSRRYGAQKLLVDLDGRPLLQHVIDAATASTARDVVLVVGHASEEVLGAARLGRARSVLNADWASGQASSLRAGLRAVAGADAAIILLGDQPRITPALVDALVERQRETGAVAVISSWNDRRSPPTLLRRELWPSIDGLAGDVGAREILAGRADVAVLEVTPELGTLQDVDTSLDMSRLRRGGR